MVKPYLANHTNVNIELIHFLNKKLPCLFNGNSWIYFRNYCGAKSFVSK